MKSRVALVAVLALGVFMSGTGATLAVSGFAKTGSASVTQYGPTTNHAKGHHVVEAATEEGGTCTSGSSSSSGANGEACAEAVQQVAVTSESSGSLPFTGFVAIPVLIVGLGLLGAGVAMRVRGRRGGGVA